MAVADDDDPPPPPATCAPAAAIEKARAAYAWHTTNNGSAAGLFWRILNTLGADNLPAKPSDVTDETVTAQAVKDISDGKSWGGWDPIVTALECVEGGGSAQQDNPQEAPPAAPEISITAGSGITEGGSASFTLTATPAPASALSVSVSVSQTGAFGVSAGAQPVSIPPTGSYTLTVATVNDSVDEPGGSVSVTVDSGTGYTVSATAGSATVAVADDDDPAPPLPLALPEVSIVSDGDITEGNSASFTLTATPAPAAALDVTVAVSQSGAFGVTPGSAPVSIPPTGSYTLTVATVNDSVDEADGSVTATVKTGTGYTVSATAGAATVAVADDDDPPPPPVNATPSLSISDASGTEGDTISFTVTLSPSSSRYVGVRYYARPRYGHSSSALYSDFDRAAYGSLTFNPGDTEKTISVLLLDDTLSEGDETFTVFLYAPAQAVIKDGEGIGTIVDAAAAPPSLTQRREDAPPPPPPPAPEKPNEVQAAPDYTALIAQIYAWRHAPQWQASQAYTERWDRALLAFGQPVTDPTLTPITAAEAQAFADRGLTRWREVAAALRALEATDPAPEDTGPVGPDPYAHLIAQMYAWRHAPQWQASQAYTERWDRALLAFGEPVPDPMLLPMTAAEAQAFVDQGLPRWGAVATALRALEAQD